MTIFIDNAVARVSGALPRVDTVAAALLRYGLAFIFVWNGLAKYTHEEAVGVHELVSHSALQAWLYNLFSVDALSWVLGAFELGAAILLVIKPFAPKISVLGSLFCTLMLLVTVSYLFTTPGIIESASNGFPLLSPLGGFLLKDIVLLGAAVWTLADAFRSGWRSEN